MKSHVFRTLPLSADSRTLRNRDLFPGCDSQCYTWERDARSRGEAHAFPLLKGGGPLGRGVKYLLFMLWVPFVLLAKGRKDDIAIFMDLETALFGIAAAKLRGIRAVFDIVDPFAQTKIGSPFLQKLVDRVEVAVAERADLVMVPHPCRMDYYQSRLGLLPRVKSLMVVENVPNFGALSSAAPQIAREAGRKTVLGYFGTLDRQNRGLEWLLGFVERYSAQYDLVVAGQGALSEEFARRAALHDNVRFHGPYQHADLVSLYDEIDFTWAYYSANISLHHFAAPNKFYEHLFFGKPIVTSAIIPQWRTIADLGTGISVNCESGDPEECDRLHEKLLLFHSSRRSEIKKSARRFWDDNYRDYYRNTSRLFQSCCAAR